MLSYDTINFHLPINGFENIENAPITQNSLTEDMLKIVKRNN